MKNATGFPMRWGMPAPSEQALAQFYEAAPLRAVLGTMGFSINILVNSMKAKRVALLLFKAWRDIERRQDAWLKKEMDAYLAYAHKYGGSF